MSMKKIAIIGCPGSGKSTLAIRLASTMDLPIFFLDEVYHDTCMWSDDKVEKKKQWREYQERLVKQPEWIIDGNYKGTLEIRVAAADTIIFLDYPRWLCLRRALRRSLSFHAGEKQLAGGNPGKVDWWFLRFIWVYRRVERPRVIELLKKYNEGKEIHILTSPRQTQTIF